MQENIETIQRHLETAKAFRDSYPNLTLGDLDVSPYGVRFFIQPNHTDQAGSHFGTTGWTRVLHSGNEYNWIKIVKDVVVTILRVEDFTPKAEVSTENFLHRAARCL